MTSKIIEQSGNMCPTKKKWPERKQPGACIQTHTVHTISQYASLVPFRTWKRNPLTTSCVCLHVFFSRSVAAVFFITSIISKHHKRIHEYCENKLCRWPVRHDLDLHSFIAYHKCFVREYLINYIFCVNINKQMSLLWYSKWIVNSFLFLQFYLLL